MEHNRGYLESILKGFTRYRTDGGYLYMKDLEKERREVFKIFESQETNECYIISSYIDVYPSTKIKSEKDISKISEALKDLELVEQDLLNKGFKRL